MSSRLKSLAVLVTSCAGGKPRPYVALENIESGTGHLLADVELPERLAPDSGAADIEIGDVLFGKLRPYLAKTWLADREAFASTELLCLRPKPGVSSGWLGYLCGSRPLVEWAVATSDGTKMPRTSWEKLSEFRVSLPALAIQHSIADYLDTETARIDALIEKKRRIVELLEESITSLVYQTIIELGHRSTIDGKRNSRQVRRLITSTNAGEVIDQSWWGDGTERLYTCARDILVSNYPSFPSWKRTGERDLLLTRNGTPYVHVPIPGSIYSNVVQRIELKEQVDRNYIALAIEAATGDMKAQGVSIDSFNYGMWKSLVIPVPSIQEQRSVTEAIQSEKEQVAKTVTCHERQLELLAEHRQALITAAVTGQLDIPGVAD